MIIINIRYCISDIVYNTCLKQKPLLIHECLTTMLTSLTVATFESQEFERGEHGSHRESHV